MRYAARSTSSYSGRVSDWKQPLKRPSPSNNTETGGRDVRSTAGPPTLGVTPEAHEVRHRRRDGPLSPGRGSVVATRQLQTIVGVTPVSKRQGLRLADSPSRPGVAGSECDWLTVTERTLKAVEPRPRLPIHPSTVRRIDGCHNPSVEWLEMETCRASPSVRGLGERPETQVPQRAVRQPRDQFFKRSRASTDLASTSEVRYTYWCVNRRFLSGSVRMMSPRQPRLNLLWGAVLALAGVFWAPGTASACSPESMSATAPSCCAVKPAGECGCCGPLSGHGPTTNARPDLTSTAVRLTPAANTLNAPVPCQCRVEQVPNTPVRPSESRGSFEPRLDRQQSATAVAVNTPSARPLGVLGSVPSEPSLPRSPLYLRTSRLLI